MTVLSDQPRTMPAMSWHPWRLLRNQPDIALRWERMPGRLGSWCERTRTITLHPDQSQAERRSTLTHELAHAAAGHGGACSQLVEAQVDNQAARELIAPRCPRRRTRVEPGRVGGRGRTVGGRRHR